jgi:hypothetical protein
MVTTDKDIERYTWTCDNCGERKNIASNQPSGDHLHVICECFHHAILRISEDENPSKHRVKMRESTKQLRAGIIDIFQDIARSMTVRQVYYQAVSKGIVDKTEQGYGVIQRNILEMRRYGHLPYSFVADLSRRRVKPNSYAGLDDALDHWMTFYRKDVWLKQPHHVEIWLEKDALSAIFAEVTEKYDVPLFIARGFSSESFLYKAANEIKRIGKPTFIYYFSDYDPSGLEMCNQVEERLPLFGCKDIYFHRAALTPHQIELYKLPSRPTKKTSHSKHFEDESTELDALHPDVLIMMVEDCILSHISEKDLENVKMEEAVHLDAIKDFQNNFRLAQNSLS